MILAIQGADVYTPQRVIPEAVVLVKGKRIAAVGPAVEVQAPEGALLLDAEGLHCVPGFIDLQINGAFGCDFTADPGAIWPVAARFPRYGVTACLPTVITSPLERIARAQAELASIPAGYKGARPLGLHVEGPFLNPLKKGAHNAEYLREPHLEAIEDWWPERGVRLVTLAPELSGALDLVRALAERGVRVSAGHTMATYEEAEAAFDAGIRYGTHLFNAMPPLAHREPGLPGALLWDTRITVGIIGDGIHTHPVVVDLAWRLLGSDRLNLVTDAMAALGMPPGKHLLGDYEVLVDERRARLADGTLAGSIISLDQTLRNLIAFTGCSLQEALPTITTTPARLLGIDGERGRVEPGLLADLVLLTPDLRIETTIAEGEVVFTRKEVS